MPFKSEKQRRFLFWKYPRLARKWAKHKGSHMGKKKRPRKKR